MMESKVALVGTRFVSLADAAIDLRSQGFNYGASVFEGIRGYWRPEDAELRIFRLRDHLVRLSRSAVLLGISLPGDVELLTELLCELARRNEYKEDFYLRPIAYKGVPEKFGITLTDAPDEFVAYSFALGAYLPRDRPLHLGVSSWRRIADDAVPARCKIGGSYVNPSLAKTEAVSRGFDECLMLTSAGTVSEGSTSNVFIVTDEGLVTPPVSEDLLVGITRATVVTLARDVLGLPVIERRLNRSELYQASEVFLTGTGAEISAVGAIDDRKIGDGSPGTITVALQQAYARAVNGELDAYREWCTPVYRDKRLAGTATAGDVGGQAR
jgi:branched-chain amino acid aminotransferase